MVFCINKFLKKKSKKYNNQEICSICLEYIENNHKSKYTECGHKFHTRCLHDWIMINNTCPICRHEISNKYKKIFIFMYNLRIV